MDVLVRQEDIHNFRVSITGRLKLHFRFSLSLCLQNVTCTIKFQSIDLKVLLLARKLSLAWVGVCVVLGISEEAWKVGGVQCLRWSDELLVVAEVNP